MTSHDLMNINQETYKYKHSNAPRRSMWRLNDIILSIIYIITHLIFTLMESQESLLFHHMLPVKILQAIPKPWQVQHEINIEMSHLLCQISADFVLLNSI